MENVFRNKNFALSFFGGLVSNVGAIFYSFTVGFYILDITGNNAVIQNNYLALCSVGLLLATLPGGVLGDRYNRAKIMYICDYLKGALVLISTFLLFRFDGNSSAQIAVLFVAGFFGNIVSGIFSPSSGALLPLIVKEEQLQQANSYQSAIQGFQSIAGVILAGILYSLLPSRTIFIIVGICYLASGVSEMFIRYDFRKPEGALTMRSAVLDLKDGFRYSVTFKPLLVVMGLSILTNFFVTPISSFAPYFVKTDVAGAGRYLFDSFLTPELWASVFQTAMGIGLISMALILSARPQREKCGDQIKIGFKWFTAAIVFVAVSYYVLFVRMGRLDLLLVVLVFGFLGAGLVMAYVNVLASTTLMRIVDKDKMGKVMGITTIAGQGLTPLASVIAGLLISRGGLTALLSFPAIGFILILMIVLRSKALDEL